MGGNAGSTRSLTRRGAGAGTIASIRRVGFNRNRGERTNIRNQRRRARRRG